MDRLHVIASGRVQGVFFRAYAQKKAQELGLTGWVRNISNGEVEAVAEGEENQLLQFEVWCHKGPPAAHVTHVNSKWLPATGEFSSFSIKM